MTSRYARFISVAAALGIGLLSAVPLAHAAGTATTSGTTATTPAKAPATPLSASVKGTLGVGMIGAELGFVLPAVAGLHETWAYIVFPLAGAAGGAALGYFALEKGHHAELAVASLTVGMLLVIPALVLTVAENEYDPGDEPSMQQAEQVESRKLASAAAQRDPRQAGSGLVRVAADGVALATPGLSVVPNDRRPRDLHLAELRLSLLSGRF